MRYGAIRMRSSVRNIQFKNMNLSRIAINSMNLLFIWKPKCSRMQTQRDKTKYDACKSKEKQEHTHITPDFKKKVLPSLQHKAKLGSRAAHRTKNLQKVNWRDKKKIYEIQFWIQATALFILFFLCMKCKKSRDRMKSIIFGILCLMA